MAVFHVATRTQCVFLAVTCILAEALFIHAQTDDLQLERNLRKYGLVRIHKSVSDSVSTDSSTVKNFGVGEMKVNQKNTPEFISTDSSTDRNSEPVKIEVDQKNAADFVSANSSTGYTTNPRSTLSSSSPHPVSIEQSSKNSVTEGAKSESNSTVDVDTKSNQTSLTATLDIPHGIEESSPIDESQLCLGILEEHNLLADSFVQVARNFTTLVVESYIEALRESCASATFYPKPFDKSCSEALAWKLSSQLKGIISKGDVYTRINSTLSSLSEKKLSLLRITKEEEMSPELNDTVLKIFEQIEQPVMELGLSCARTRGSNLLYETVRDFRNRINSSLSDLLPLVRNEVDSKLDTIAETKRLHFETVTNHFLNNTKINKEKPFQSPLFSEMIRNLVNLTIGLKDDFVKDLESSWIELALHATDKMCLPDNLVAQIPGIIDDYYHQQGLVKAELNELKNTNILENLNQSESSIWEQASIFAVPVRQVMRDSMVLSRQLFVFLKNISVDDSFRINIHSTVIDALMKSMHIIKRKVPPLLDINFFNSKISFNASALSQIFENVSIRMFEECENPTSEASLISRVPPNPSTMQQWAKLDDSFEVSTENTKLESTTLSVSRSIIDEPSLFAPSSNAMNGVQVEPVPTPKSFDMTTANIGVMAGNDSTSTPNPNRGTTPLPVTVSVEPEENTNFTSPFGTSPNDSSSVSAVLVSTSSDTNSTNENSTVAIEANPSISTPSDINGMIISEFVAHTERTNVSNFSGKNISLENETPLIATPVLKINTNTTQRTSQNESSSIMRIPKRTTNTLQVTVTSKSEENISITTPGHTATNLSSPVSTESSPKNLDLDGSITELNSTTDAGIETNQTSVSIGPDSPDGNNSIIVGEAGISTSGGQLIYPFKYTFLFVLLIYRVIQVR